MLLIVDPNILITKAHIA
nr:unnamed protein product [Callosobruchus analis]